MALVKLMKSQKKSTICALYFYLTAIFFETGAMSTPTKSPNPTILSQGGLASTQ